METVSIYFRQTDAISLTTAAILLIMSIMTWSVILLKYGDYRRQRLAERRFLDWFWPQPAQNQVLAAQPNHALIRLAQTGLDIARRCARSSRADELDAWVTRALRQALDAESAALEREPGVQQFPDRHRARRRRCRCVTGCVVHHRPSFSRHP